MFGKITTDLRVPAIRGLFLLTLLLVLALSSTAQTSSVEKAISFLRQIDPDKVKATDEEMVVKQIEAAWDTIHKAGPTGEARLKQELGQPGQSDYFKLNGAALLWDLSGLDEADTIASIWSSTRLEVQSNYVFYPAFEAAQKQDSRALPMLVAVLGNDKFSIYVAPHAMDVKWPLTIQFIWGAFGPKGLPVLLNVLKNSHSSIEIQSATILLTDAQYLDALPVIRDLAHARDADSRRTAITALGFFGHPQDYDFLIAGLQSTDREDVFRYAIALYEYEDLRAVPHLIPLLEAPDQRMRHEAFAGLSHLLTSQSVDALVKYAQRARGEEKAEVNEYLESELKEYGVTLSNYLQKSGQEKAEAIDSVRRQREANRFLLHRGEKDFTHAEFVNAAEAWKKSHHMRMSSGDMPVGVQRILTAATVNDLELLLEVKAAVFARLSDEGLGEAQRIDTVIKRLGRSRYRKDAGITEKAEAR